MGNEVGELRRFGVRAADLPEGRSYRLEARHAGNPSPGLGRVSRREAWRARRTSI